MTTDAINKINNSVNNREGCQKESKLGFFFSIDYRVLTSLLNVIDFSSLILYSGIKGIILSHVCEPPHTIKLILGNFYP